ncbi:MAG: class I SAM-dependent methyltransferase [Deltaproteobacteria bacterium]|nr:class I SAM-dependent methyltransferase [Deltaproteobacteria bacterium]
MENPLQGNHLNMIQDARIQQRKRYADDHWIRSTNHEKAMQAYLEQQGKAYSRIKNAFIIELLGNIGHKRFLDYGCGPGMFLGHAAQSGASLVAGIDIEETVLSTARYFTKKQRIADACAFLLSDQFPAFSSDARFDAILLKDVLEHVEDDQSLLNAAAKALTPNGIVVISTQNALSLNYLIEGTYQRIICSAKDWCGWDPTHLRFYTPQKLKAKLKMAGLRCIAWRSIYLIPHKIPAPFSSGRQFYRLESLTQIDSLLGRFFPWNRLGWNIIIKAVKH